MKPGGLQSKLAQFALENRFTDTSALSVALILTETAKKEGLPLDPSDFITEGGGQVRGLSGSKLKSLLAKHGIVKQLSREGGRTSRGTPGKMKQWIAFMNSEFSSVPDFFAVAEAFWISRVRDHFAAKPFRVRLDPSRSLRAAIRDILDQARTRQKAATGTNYVGAVMQHLVGAKLVCALPSLEIAHYSFSTADEQSGRDGDFDLRDSVVHVTASPSPALISRCQHNLSKGKRPIIVTLGKGVPTAELFAADQNLSDRIDIFELEQFVALNIYELGEFTTLDQNVAVISFIEAYNGIVDRVEADPSLRLQMD